MGVLLAGVHDVIGLIWFTAIIFGASVARRILARPHVLRVVDRLAGVVIIGFAIKLAIDTVR